MIFKKIPLDEKYDNVYLDAYIADKLHWLKRDAILIIPGGGYGSVCSDREGEPIAQAFIPHGYNAFVLHYSVNRQKTYPGQLIEASLAIKHIKDHADEYGIDPDRVFVTGFSAGGHLCASLGVLWHRKEVYDAIDMPYGYNKPAGIMPVYPVISSDPSIAHMGTFHNLLGNDAPTEEKMAWVSIEKHVDEKSAPLFLMHTSNDGAVDVRNSLVLASAYAAAGLTFEMHIYPDAPHGVALGNAITKGDCDKFDNPCIAKWIEHAAAWAKGL